MRLALLASLLIAAALAAGCFDTGPRAVSAYRAPADAPTSAGVGLFTLRVLVTDEPGGPPVAGARVAVSTFTAGAHVVTRLTTDEHGVATARTPAGRSAYVSAWSEGFTDERLDDVRLGGVGGSAELPVPLFRERVRLETNDSLPPAGGSGHRVGATEFSWEPRELALGGNDATRVGYASRIIHLNATLDWENGLMGGGDLGIGLGRSAERPDVVRDTPNEAVAAGRVREALAMDLRAMYEAGWADARTLHAGAGTGTVYVAPLGLPYTLAIEAYFDGSRPQHSTPGPAAAAAVAALAGAAAVLGRARR